MFEIDDISERGELSATERRRDFFEGVDVTTNGITAIVSVTHSSDRLAVQIANAVATSIVSEVELFATENFARHTENMRLRLASLNAPSSTLSQSVDLIQLEVAAIEAELELIERYLVDPGAVAVIDRSAELPAVAISPRKPLIIALGGILGFFIGIGAAIASSASKGRLHSFGAVAGAFGECDAILVNRKDITNGASETFWQYVRVSLGEFDSGAIVVTGFVEDDIMAAVAMGLASEFARSGVPVAAVDLGARFPKKSKSSEFGEAVSILETDCNLWAYGCDLKESVDLIERLSEGARVVIVLPPSPRHDLWSVRATLLPSKGRVLLAKRGKITRHEITRLSRTERGATGPCIVLVM